MSHLHEIGPSPPDYVSRPQPLLAALFSLLGCGVGQIYCGHIRRGVAIYLGLHAVALGYLLVVLSYLPGSPAFDALAWLLSPLLRLASAWDAWRLARKTPVVGRPGGMACTVGLMALLFLPALLGMGRLFDRYWPLGRTYFIPSRAMSPTLQVGDYILVAPVASPRLHDIVVFAPP